MAENNVFEKVSQLFRSVDATVAAANILDKAYADGVGHPEYHTQFGVESPEKVAMAIAGLYAADTAANILLAGSRRDENGRFFGENYRFSLRRLVTDDPEIKLIQSEKYVVKNVANATWRAGQPFRDITTKPLQRVTRDINMQFNLLPPDEEDKDLIQVRIGAAILLNWIDKGMVSAE